MKKEDLGFCKKIIEKCLENSIEYKPEVIDFLRKEFNELDYFKLRANKGGIFVFEEKGIIKGMGCADGNWIRKVFVDPDFKNVKIWEKIMDYLEKIIFSEGFKEIFLYAYPNLKNICLKRGYSIVEEKIFGKGKLNFVGIKMKKSSTVAP
ncbi:MAG: GNAT family N-acetyltransferase [archaeon]